MPKTELKTKQNDGDVLAFLNSIENDQRRQDGLNMLRIMGEVTGEEPKLWGPSIVGFGTYHYVYDSGREADWMATGFSPRKQSLTLYIMSGFARYDELMERLGKHKTGKSCLYIKKLEDVDEGVLRELIQLSFDHIRAKYPAR